MNLFRQGFGKVPPQTVCSVYHEHRGVSTYAGSLVKKCTVRSTGKCAGKSAGITEEKLGLLAHPLCAMLQFPKRLSDTAHAGSFGVLGAGDFPIANRLCYHTPVFVPFYTNTALGLSGAPQAVSAGTTILGCAAGYRLGIGIGSPGTLCLLVGYRAGCCHTALGADRLCCRTMRLS